jgi:aspartate/methionine/tyrosine aminotransferase
MNTHEQCGLKPMKPDGGYFIIANIDPLDDGDISKFLTTKVGVTLIPIGAFYQKKDVDSFMNLVRFAFCKDEATLQNAHEKLLAWFKK